MNLLIDPDVTSTRTSPALRAMMARTLQTPTRFGYYLADDSGPRCGRCNDLLHVHRWQLIDDGTVIDCEVQL